MSGPAIGLPAIGAVLAGESEPSKSGCKMTDGSEHLLIGRLAILPFAFVQWGVLLWYLSSLRRLRDNFLKRLIGGAVSIATIFAVTFGQMEAYTIITSMPHPMTDNFFFITFSIEHAASIFFIFYAAIKRTSKQRGRIYFLQLPTRMAPWAPNLWGPAMGQMLL
ncbi:MULTISPECIES: hypothetical protein [Pseudomonas]|jgi:hypothetical protein|uniref:hypothetical protein n=4 Tax=Pseudomonas TaxID=286 RepID=UPI000B34CB80|nr:MULTISPECIES: hypothetical protein [Pseudomonas]MBD9607917.1 hypothetical protein [Pseudomonas sp. PDM08]MDR7109697.1 hypothetical protein [Pseudomonas frederiksbergensis]PMY90062.1 hypothetical protein C1X67_25720 [Pseudomonas sp. FW305-62]PNA39073.1 hypothetical protein C1X71_27450 [Pseudomonas sp. FW306-2-2C-A10BC]PNA82407.1 hypothetical protein C1X66_26795 [Pseudomonas sp. MPR-R3B]